MARKKSETQVEEIKKTEHVLIVRPKTLLDGGQLNLLSDVVKQEEERAGVKIVLLPFSVDLVEFSESIVEDKEKETGGLEPENDAIGKEDKGAKNDNENPNEINEQPNKQEEK